MCHVSDDLEAEGGAVVEGEQTVARTDEGRGARDGVRLVCGRREDEVVAGQSDVPARVRAQSGVHGLLVRSLVQEAQHVTVHHVTSAVTCTRVQ